MESRSLDIERNRQDSLYVMPWVAGRPRGYYFVAHPLEINASPATVWGVVKSIDQYQNFSNGSVTASLPQHELKVNNTIHLVLYQDKLIGKFIPASDERISLLDDEKYVVAWERELPFKGGMTECYRLLEPIDEGRRTRSHIALKIPGFAGFFTNTFLKKSVEGAFNDVNAGIKKAAEEHQPMI